MRRMGSLGSLALAMAAMAPNSPPPAVEEQAKPTPRNDNATRLAFGDLYYRGIGGATRSRKRDAQRALMAQHRITSGRQWRKLRKALRNG